MPHIPRPVFVKLMWTELTNPLVVLPVSVVHASTACTGIAFDHAQQYAVVCDVVACTVHSQLIWCRLLCIGTMH